MARSAAARVVDECGLEPLGTKLRECRHKRGLTLQEVAEGAGLSAGFISQLERDLVSPSLSSLASISKVLQTDISEFLVMAGTANSSTRSGKRPVYAFEGSKSQFERISANFDGRVMNAVILVEEPGHRSEPIRHEGEELFFVLEGSITVELEDERTILNAGDSIHFRSSRLHSTWNHTTESASILIVLTMDVFGDASEATGITENGAVDNGGLGTRSNPTDS